ncbi:MAG TPA: VWA domain-containing protein [Vicinamibacterales bacterium]|nr:VWA domain-containing protein [Vicinamibacterales bacterium]
MKTSLSFLAAIAAFVALALTPAAPAAQSRSAGKMHIRHVFVSVTDGKGAAVEGLAAADFTVSEDGQPRVVSRAGPAKDPMRIALMLDTSDAAAPALTHMRAGALAFLDALPPEDEVILITTGRQVRVRVPPSTDRKRLKDSAAGLFSDGAGTVLMDGLLEIDDRFFKKADDRWPVFVIFTSDGTEASQGAREKEFTKWSPMLPARGITVHAFVMKTPKSSGMPEIVAENLTRNTGGRYDVMNTTTALPEKMKALGDQLALDHRNMSAWYELDVQTDQTELKPVAVAVNREGVRLQISNSRRGQ